MKRADVIIGNTYRAKVSGIRVNVRIDSECEAKGKKHRGWFATNLLTGRKIHIATAARLTAAAVRCGECENCEALRKLRTDHVAKFVTSLTGVHEPLAASGIRQALLNEWKEIVAAHPCKKG